MWLYEMRESNPNRRLKRQSKVITIRTEDSEVDRIARDAFVRAGFTVSFCFNFFTHILEIMIFVVRSMRELGELYKNIANSKW